MLREEEGGPRVLAARGLHTKLHSQLKKLRDRVKQARGAACLQDIPESRKIGAEKNNQTIVPVSRLL